MSELVAKFNKVLGENGGRLDEAAREKANGILKGIDDKYSLTKENVKEYRQWTIGQVEN
ncbi:MAG: hypothetical protein AB9844_07025 [Clostridiaceae bacterium]